MPSAKSGSASNLVAPASPRTAKDADVADPGKAEKQSGQGHSSSAGSGAGSSSSTSSAASTPTDPVHKPDPKKAGWIEIAMVDEQGTPVTSLAYSVKLPDGTVAEGTLGDDGVARVEGFDPGTCQITFPELDQEAWAKS